MALLEEHFLLREHLQPGQTVWMAVAADERPGYRKSMRQTRQVPVVLTLVNQEDITALKQGAAHQQVLQEAVARVTHEAYQQGGVLSLVDLGLLFARSPNAVREAMILYEERTQQVLPRRGTVHDLGMTVSHKRLICYKAFVEAKNHPHHRIGNLSFPKSCRSISIGLRPRLLGCPQARSKSQRHRLHHWPQPSPGEYLLRPHPGVWLG